jgi:hypothetical protein
MTILLTAWRRAFLSLLELEQPTELPAKPCKSEIVTSKTKLIYERDQYFRHETGGAEASDGPGGDGE